MEGQMVRRRDREKVDERGKECIDHGYVECIGGGEGAWEGEGCITLHIL